MSGAADMCINIKAIVSLSHYLVILAAGAKAKDEQVSVGVGGCKMLPIWTTFAVKQRSVALALDLSREREIEITVLQYQAIVWHRHSQLKMSSTQDQMHHSICCYVWFLQVLSYRILPK